MQTSARPLARPANPPGALSPAPWPPVCSMVVQYASQIPSSRQTQPVLQSQVENLLRRTYGRWKSQSPSQGAGPAVTDIPWDDVIALCIDHKLRDWTPPRLPVLSGRWCLAPQGPAPRETSLVHFQQRKMFSSCGSLSFPSLGLPLQASDF